MSAAMSIEQRHLDEDQRLVGHAGMDERVAAPIVAIEAVLEVVPTGDLVHRLVLDELLQERPGGIPGDATQLEQPGGEELGQHPLQAAIERFVLGMGPEQGEQLGPQIDGELHPAVEAAEQHEQGFPPWGAGVAQGVDGDEQAGARTVRMGSWPGDPACCRRCRGTASWPGAAAVPSGRSSSATSSRAVCSVSNRGPKSSTNSVKNWARPSRSSAATTSATSPPRLRMRTPPRRSSRHASTCSRRRLRSRSLRAASLRGPRRQRAVASSKPARAVARTRLNAMGLVPGWCAPEAGTRRW